MEIINQDFFLVDPPYYQDLLIKIENAGRICYQSESKGESEDFVRGIIARGHDSVIEHASLTVWVTTDRGVTHELVRHRIASYSQESTRYCRYTHGLTFIRPVDLSEDHDSWFEAFCERAEAAYLAGLNMGLSPQLARACLPNALKSEIMITANLREWRHIFKLRTSKAAHPQMRDLMIRIHDEFKYCYPVFFEDIKVE